MRKWLTGMSASVILLIMAGAVPAQSPEKTARIGVLAFRGPEAAQHRWDSLARYLAAAVDGWRFEIVPLTLVSAPGKINSKQIEFLITNPGHFTDMAPDQPLSVLATRERFVPGKPEGVLTFGTVIFTRKNAGIRTFGDLAGKRLAAVSPDAFGGFQIAWDELRRQGMDAFTDLGAIQFMGFPQDEIVSAVASGAVDAGVVRSGLLEALQAEGRIKIADFEILNRKSQPEYPFLVTGHLYPEWPFLALSWIDKDLREAVSLALIGTQKPDVRMRFALQDLWSAPLSYDGVRQLVNTFNSRDLPAAVTSPWGRDTVAFATFVLGIFMTLALTLAFSRKLRRFQPPTAAAGSRPDPSDSPELVEARLNFENLTLREREVLCKICSGQTSKAIADDLGISPKTVEFHRANLLQKTKAGTTARLVQLATRLDQTQGFLLGESRQ